MTRGKKIAICSFIIGLCLYAYMTDDKNYVFAPEEESIAYGDGGVSAEGAGENGKGNIPDMLCGDVLKLSGEDRAALYYWIDGFVAAESGTTRAVFAGRDDMLREMDNACRNAEAGRLSELHDSMKLSSADKLLHAGISAFREDVDMLFWIDGYLSRQSGNTDFSAAWISDLSAIIDFKIKKYEKISVKGVIEDILLDYDIADAAGSGGDEEVPSRESVYDAMYGTDIHDSMAGAGAAEEQDGQQYMRKGGEEPELFSFSGELIESVRNGDDCRLRLKNFRGRVLDIGYHCPHKQDIDRLLHQSVVAEYVYTGSQDGENRRMLLNLFQYITE